MSLSEENKYSFVDLCNDPFEIPNCFKIKLGMLASPLMISGIGESVVVSPYHFLKGCTFPLTPAAGEVQMEVVPNTRKGRGRGDCDSLRSFCDFSYPVVSYKFQNYCKKYANL